MKFSLKESAGSVRSWVGQCMYVTKGMYDLKLQGQHYFLITLLDPSLHVSLSVLILYIILYDKSAVIWSLFIWVLSHSIKVLHLKRELQKPPTFHQAGQKFCVMRTEVLLVTEVSEEALWEHPPKSQGLLALISTRVQKMTVEELGQNICVIEIKINYIKFSHTGAGAIA